MSNFFRIMSWLMLSSALWGSMKIILVTKLLSKHFKMLLFKKERHVSVECFFLKPE